MPNLEVEYCLPCVFSHDVQQARETKETKDISK